MNNPFRAVGVESHVGELARFGVVGLASNLFGYLVYLLITYWGIEPNDDLVVRNGRRHRLLWKSAVDICP